MSHPLLPGNTSRLILASASPRRAALLRQWGIPFRKVVSGVKEEHHPELTPRQLVKQLAADKAAAVAREHKKGIVAGFDTIVVLDGKILGKPKNRKEAFRMLNKLSGRMHQVFSGIAVCYEGSVITDTEMTRVYFRNITPKEISEYITTGESMDKAGAYGIQEKGGLFVRKITGCYYNVVGLPSARFISILNTLRKLYDR